MRSSGPCVLAVFLAVLLSMSSESSAFASSKHKSSPKPKPIPTPVKYRPTKAQTEASRMIKALRSQERIQVRGRLKNATGTTRILLRYEKTGREYEQETGPSFKHIVTTHGPLGGQWTISVGKTLWRSYDRKNWLKQRRAAAPAPLDAISLTPSGSACCRPGNDTAVRDIGQSHGLIRLAYRNGMGPSLVSGTIYISPRSYLPVSYTVESGTGGQALNGAFQLSYTGTFTITPPK